MEHPKSTSQKTFDNIRDGLREIKNRAAENKDGWLYDRADTLDFLLLAYSSQIHPSAISSGLGVA